MMELAWEATNHEALFKFRREGRTRKESDNETELENSNLATRPTTPCEEAVDQLLSYL